MSRDRGHPSPPRLGIFTGGEVPDPRFVGDLFASLAGRYNAAVLGYSLGQDLRWKHTTVRRARLRRGDRALDLATGTGLILDRVARRVGSDSVVGLDRSRSMLGHTTISTVPRALVRGNAERLPFRDRSFDVVTAGYLFKYVRLDPFLKEVRRVLRPGGRLAGYDFSHPRTETLSGRLYSIYLHRALPWLARRSRTGGADWAGLIDFLGAVSESSRWEDRIAEPLQANGFLDVRREPSLGGAVTWVSARLPDAA